MSKRSSHIQQGLGFLVGCSLLGAFLYIVNNDSDEASRRAAFGTAVEASANKAAEKLDAEADSIDDAARSKKGIPAARSADTAAAPLDVPAGQQAKSVFGDGLKGTLLCAFDGSKQFTVGWETNDQSGVVSVNGHLTNGTVIGDWEPGPNKIRYDIKVGGPNDADRYHIEIADDGSLSGEGGKAGSCRATA